MIKLSSSDCRLSVEGAEYGSLMENEAKPVQETHRDDHRERERENIKTGDKYQHSQCVTAKRA